MLERRETHKHFHSLLPLVPSLSGPPSRKNSGRKSSSVLAAAAIVLMEHNSKHMALPQFPGAPSPRAVHHFCAWPSELLLCPSQALLEVRLNSALIPIKQTQLPIVLPAKQILLKILEGTTSYITLKKSFNSSLDISLATCCLISLLLLLRS